MDALAIAEATAREAGALLMTYYGRPLTIESKAARNDLVTSADRASEALIVRRLLAATPEAAVLAEETGLHAGSAAQRWIVDPLDGTTNFAHAYPPFCVSIAFEEEGELVAAVVFAPKFDECFTAQSGGGARLNGEPIRVSAIAHIEDALVCTGFSPRVPDRNFTEFALMTRHAQAVRRDGSAALNLAYLAAGRFDCFWEYDLKPWDVAAGAFLIREAGGTVTNIDGSPLRLDGAQIMATNGPLHAPLAALFSSSSSRPGIA
mgnify:CR=1 FL=1